MSFQDSNSYKSTQPNTCHIICAQEMIALPLLASLEFLRLSVLPVSQRTAYEKIIYSQNDLRAPPELIQGPVYLRPFTSARLSSLWDVVQHHIEIFVALLLISFMSPLSGRTHLTLPTNPLWHFFVQISMWYFPLTLTLLLYHLFSPPFLHPGLVSLLMFP